jgi:hypothetical protein
MLMIAEPLLDFLGTGQLRGLSKTRTRYSGKDAPSDSVSFLGLATAFQNAFSAGLTVFGNAAGR